MRDRDGDKDSIWVRLYIYIYIFLDELLFFGNEDMQKKKVGYETRVKRKTRA